MKRQNFLAPVRRGSRTRVLLLALLAGGCFYEPANAQSYDAFSYNLTGLYTTGTYTDEAHHLIIPYSYNVPPYSDADMLAVSVGTKTDYTTGAPAYYIRYRAINSADGSEAYITEIDLSTLTTPFDNPIITGIAYNSAQNRYAVTGYGATGVGVPNKLAFIVEIEADLQDYRYNSFELGNAATGIATGDVYTVPLDITYANSQYYVAGYIANEFNPATNYSSANAILPDTNLHFPFQYGYTNTANYRQYGFIARVVPNTLAVGKAVTIGLDNSDPSNAGKNFCTAINRIKADATGNYNLLFTGTGIQDKTADLHGAILAGGINAALTTGEVRTSKVGKLPGVSYDNRPGLHNYVFATGNDIVAKWNSNFEPEYYLTASTAELTDYSLYPEYTLSSVVVGKIDFPNTFTMALDPAQSVRYFPYNANVVTGGSTYDLNFLSAGGVATISRWRNGEYTIAKVTDILEDPLDDTKISIGGHMHSLPLGFSTYMHTHPVLGTSPVRAVTPFILGNIDISVLSAPLSCLYTAYPRYASPAANYDQLAVRPNKFLNPLNPVLNNLNFIKRSYPAGSNDRVVFTTSVQEYKYPDYASIDPLATEVNTYGTLNVNNAELDGNEISCGSIPYEPVPYDPALQNLTYTYLISDNPYTSTGVSLLIGILPIASYVVDCQSKGYMRPTASRELQLQEALRLMPNPARDYIRLNNTGSVPYRVLGIDGRETGRGLLHAGERISTGHYMPGLYILEVRLAEQGPKQFKFIKE